MYFINSTLLNQGKKYHIQNVNKFKKMFPYTFY